MSKISQKVVLGNAISFMRLLCQNSHLDEMRNDLVGHIRFELMVVHLVFKESHMCLLHLVALCIVNSSAHCVESSE